MVPSPASRRNICNARPRAGEISGQIRTLVSITATVWRWARPSGPYQRSQPRAIWLVPRRDGAGLPVACHCPAPACARATSSRPPGQSRGSVASATCGRVQPPAWASCASMQIGRGSPTSPSAGAETRNAIALPASNPSTSTSSAKAPPAAGPTVHASGEIAATTSDASANPTNSRIACALGARLAQFPSLGGDVAMISAAPRSG